MAKLTGPRAKVTMKFRQRHGNSNSILMVTADPASARFSSAKKARSKSIAIKWPVIRKN